MISKELIESIRAHYESRGFSRDAILHLASVLQNSVQDGRIEIHNSLGDFSKPLDELLPSQFPVIAQSVATTDQLNQAQAIIAFSFGYRHKSRQVEGEEKRLPGQNNRALAEIAASAKTAYALPLYAQFEIADALDDYTDQSADFSSPAADLSTAAVTESFRDQSPAFQNLQKVILVAHQYHIARCALLLLNDFNIHSIPAPQSYVGYDPREVQPRVANAETYILSDFVSMAAHKHWIKTLN